MRVGECENVSVALVALVVQVALVALMVLMALVTLGALEALGGPRCPDGACGIFGPSGCHF